MKTIRVILLCVLLLTGLACQVANQALGARQAYIRVGTDPSVTVSPSDLDQARSILQNRLDKAPLKGRASVVVDGESIRVDLTAASDLEAAVALVSQTGAVDFLSADEVLYTGATVPPGLPVILTEADFQSASVQTNTAGQPDVAFTLTAEGTKKLADFTSANIGKFLVIARDRIVVSSPRIASAIQDGEGIISGNFSEEEAAELAAILTAGRLPFPPVVLETKLAQ
jgi:preprotein translocase subunit SecD